MVVSITETLLMFSLFSEALDRHLYTNVGSILYWASETQPGNLCILSLSQHEKCVSKKIENKDWSNAG